MNCVFSDKIFGLEIPDCRITHAFYNIWNLGEGGLLGHVLLHSNEGRLVESGLLDMR